MVFEEGFRVLNFNYGFYGSIDTPYAMYEIIEKERTNYHLLKDYPEISTTQSIDCKANDGIELLEHLYVGILNSVTKLELSCLHHYIEAGAISRLNTGLSILVPLVNRVVNSLVLDLTLSIVNSETKKSNEDLNEELQELTTKVEPRLFDSKTASLIQLLIDHKVPTYDIEDDSRILGLGEGANFLVVPKKIVDNKLRYLQYPFRSLDLDEITHQDWKVIELAEDFWDFEDSDKLEILQNFNPLRNLLQQPQIPKHLVTGTNGKTTTTRLLAHILRGNHNQKIGLTSTSGIYIDGEEPLHGDYTGPWSAREALMYPIEQGVLEVARGGLIREGVIFSEVSTSILTNVASDHIGMRGIETVEDMGKLKSLIFHAATNAIVINADEPIVVQLLKNHQNQQLLKKDVTIWAISQSPNAVEDYENAIYLENDEIVLKQHINRKVDLKVLGYVEELKFSEGGLISFMVINSLLALAAAIGGGIDPQAAFRNLTLFQTSLEEALGRGNLFKHHNRWFMLDYGHNPHALKQQKITLENLIQNYNIDNVVYLALAAGDRRNEDLIEYAKILSEFPIDHVIFKDLWKDRRGRAIGEVGRFIASHLATLEFEGEIHQVPEPVEAITHALRLSKEGSLVYLCAEKADVMRELIMTYPYEST